MREILFICTGNYYRSRFAEAIFNHRMQTLGLPWRAFSRGLMIHLVEGDLSPHTEEALRERGIDAGMTGSTRIALTEDDLARAQHIILLKLDEHRPMMEKQFPEWADKVTYWAVHDIDYAEPAQALAEIETKVEALLTDLAGEESTSSHRR